MKTTLGGIVLLAASLSLSAQNPATPFSPQSILHGGQVIPLISPKAAKDAAARAAQPQRGQAR